MKRELYPADWEQLTAQLKDEVGQCCEQCGVENHVWIYRNKLDPSKWIGVDQEEELYYHRTLYPTKPHEVVLTTAHLDRNPANNERSNLRVLCQRCYLVYDSPHHVENARQTRIKKKRQAKLKAGQLAIFEGDKQCPQ